MLRIPHDTPKRASRKMKAGELAYYETMAEEFKQKEVERASKKDTIEDLQATLDQRISFAIQRRHAPHFDSFEPLVEEDSECLKRLHEFYDKRNAVPSPRWENELKAKFGKGT